MANAFPTQLVASPARVPAQYGLFSVLSFREPADRHWEAGGVQWESLNGSTALGVVGAIQATRSETFGLPKEFSTDDDVDAAAVFTVYGQQKITPIAWPQDRASERARARLTALEERQVERVLAGVDVGAASPVFADAAPFTAAADADQAIALLEDFLADNYGSRGVIHLSRYQAILALKGDVLETRNNGLFTVLGTPVVAGQGYANGVAYCTSALVGYRSDVFDNIGQSYDLLDKDTNDLYAIAERTYCIGFESAALGAVTIGDSPA